jgi:hypothetical protein
MNVSYEVKGDCLFVDITGELSLPVLRGILSEWIEKVRDHTLKRILCDITFMTGLTAQQMLALIRFNTGELIVRAIPKDFKVAVVETPQQIIESQSRFAENMLVNRGVNLKVTDNLDEALRWLDVISVDKLAGADDERAAP